MTFFEAKFEPRDLWIGLFWDQRDDGFHIWVCPVPCFVLHWVIGPKWTAEAIADVEDRTVRYDEFFKDMAKKSETMAEVLRNGTKVRREALDRIEAILSPKEE